MMRVNCVIFFVSLFFFCDISFASNKDVVTTEFGDASIKKFDDEKCWTDLQRLFSGLNTSEPWAIKMVDASTKLQAGLLAGNLVDFGHWDECLAVDSGTFRGQHCLVFVKPKSFGKSTILPKGFFQSNESPQNRDLYDSVEIGLSYCIPSSCRGSEVQKAVEDLLKKMNIFPEGLPLRTDDDFCNTNERDPFSALEYIAIGVFSLFGFLMLASTCHDAYLRHTEQKPQNILWLAFSMLSNGEKIFKISPPSKTKTDSISCIHGLRALSILWVVFCHRFMMFSTVPAVFNLFDVLGYLEEYRSTILTGGVVSVDTFFILSGFLLTYLMLKQLTKTGGRLPWIPYYVHRYLRLTPPVAAVVLLHCSFFYRFSFGPFWKSGRARKELREDCQLYWWAPLVYIQNYYNTNNMCITQSWYLSVDMQFYIIAPLLLIPLFKWPKPTLAFIGVLSLAAVGINFAITYVNDFSGAMANVNAGEDGRIQMVKLYFPAHTRFAPWLFGMVLGYIMHKTRTTNIRINKGLCLLIWVVTLAMIPAVVLGGYRFYIFEWKNDVILSSFYQALHRQAWSLLICWLIFACHNGYGGPINWFLSLGIWQPLAKLSYCIYLLHYQMQTTKTMARKTTMYFNEFDLIAELWSDIGICITVSLLWSLAFESPITVLEKVAFGGQRREKPAPKKTLINGDTEQGSLEEPKEITEINNENGNGNGKEHGHVNEAYEEKL